MKTKAPKTKLPDTWTTRDGRVVPIVDMTDRHLTNTIRMLERDCQKIVASEAMRVYFNLDDDLSDGVWNALQSGAAKAHRISQDPALAAAWMKKQPRYHALVKEQKRRQKRSREVEIVAAGEELLYLLQIVAQDHSYDVADSPMSDRLRASIVKWRAATVGVPCRPAIKDDAMLDHLKLQKIISAEERDHLMDALSTRDSPHRPFWTDDPDLEHVDPYGDT